jgi:hypothetical protein
MRPIPTQAPAAPDTDLPPLPDGWTIPDTADDAGELCMIRAQFGDPQHPVGDPILCKRWATQVLHGMCGLCWRPIGTLACEPCADATVQLSAADPASPDFELRTNCCAGPFLLAHMEAL